MIELYGFMRMNGLWDIYYFEAGQKIEVSRYWAEGEVDNGRAIWL